MLKISTKTLVLGVSLLGFAAGQTAFAEPLIDANVDNSFVPTSFDKLATVNVILTGYHGNTAFTTAGGDIAATLNGKHLGPVYCIDIPNPLPITKPFVTGGPLPNTYNAYYNNQGLVPNDNLPNPPFHYNTLIPATGGITDVASGNEAKIAILMDEVAKTAITDAAQGGLQAAIWHYVYGGNFSLAPAVTAFDNAEKTAYNADIALAEAQYNHQPHHPGVQDLLWITPYTNKHSGEYNPPKYDSHGVELPQYPTYQALVTTIPVPGTLAMSSILLGIGGVVVAFRKLRKSTVAA